MTTGAGGTADSRVFSQWQPCWRWIPLASPAVTCNCPQQLSLSLYKYI